MSKKSYSTFHGYDRHKDRIHLDQTIKEVEGESGVLICTSCKAIYHNKHWYAADTKDLKSLQSKHKREALCPGCDHIRKQLTEGEVIIKNLHIKGLSEMESLIKNTEDKCRQNNPAARISSVVKQDDSMEITTTNKFLAVRIGKELKKAYKGELEIKRSPERNFVRVVWSNS